MAVKGDTVYVLRTWETDGYHSFDRHLEIFLSKYDADMRGKWLQEDYYLVNGDDADTFHYSIVAKELS